MIIISDIEEGYDTPLGMPVRSLVIAVNGKNVSFSCDIGITAAQFVLDNEDMILEKYYKQYADEDDKILIRPDYLFGSPKKPKTKQEAKDRLKKEMDKYDTGELKSVAEIVTCLLYLMDNLKDSAFKD